MPTPTRVKKKSNLVEHDRVYAEQFLTALIEAGGVPKNFSGFLTPKFGKYVHIWQFDKNKLIGSAAVHMNNAKEFTHKIVDSARSVDWNGINDVDEEEVIADVSGEPDTSGTV